MTLEEKKSEAFEKWIEQADEEERWYALENKVKRRIESAWYENDGPFDVLEGFELYDANEYVIGQAIIDRFQDFADQQTSDEPQESFKESAYWSDEDQEEWNEQEGDDKE